MILLLLLTAQQIFLLLSFLLSSLLLSYRLQEVDSCPQLCLCLRLELHFILKLYFVLMHSCLNRLSLFQLVCFYHLYLFPLSLFLFRQLPTSLSSQLFLFLLQLFFLFQVFLNVFFLSQFFLSLVLDKKSILIWCIHKFMRLLLKRIHCEFYQMQPKQS